MNTECPSDAGWGDRRLLQRLLSPGAVFRRRALRARGRAWRRAVGGR